MLTLCYTWFARGTGKQFEIPTRWGSQGRINLIGTLDLFGDEETLEIRELKGSCNQDQVIAYLETLAGTASLELPVRVVLDNATFHKGAAIRALRPKPVSDPARRCVVGIKTGAAVGAKKQPIWEARGLVLKYLPATMPVRCVLWSRSVLSEPESD